MNYRIVALKPQDNHQRRCAELCRYYRRRQHTIIPNRHRLSGLLLLSNSRAGLRPRRYPVSRIRATSYNVYVSLADPMTLDMV